MTLDSQRSLHGINLLSFLCTLDHGKAVVGVPTSRALTVVTSDEPVYRETTERGDNIPPYPVTVIG